MMDHYIADQYFRQLVTDAFLLSTDRRIYLAVLRELHSVPFSWLLVSDDNRTGDAVTFRQYEFLDQLKLPKDIDPTQFGNWATSAPSVLEVLLGCARRWHFYYGGPSVSHYFGHMFRNLGLNNFPGPVLDPGQKDYIRETLDIWLGRTFEPNGVGSPWPISGTPEDQRRIDMWGQMNAYSVEHFQ